MAHDTHGASHAKALPADLSAPSFVDGWRSRALIVAAVAAIVAVILAFLGQAQDQLGWDHVSARMGSRSVAHLRLDSRWPRASHGPVLLRRQVGPACFAALSKPQRAHCLSSSVLGRFRNLHESALYLWAQYTNPNDTAAALQSRLDQRNSGALPQLQAAHAEPDDLCGCHSALLCDLGLCIPGV